MFCCFFMYVSFLLRNNNLYSISCDSCFVMDFHYFDMRMKVRGSSVYDLFSVEYKLENHFCLHGRKRQFIMGHCLVHVVDWVGLMVVVVRESIQQFVQVERECGTTITPPVSLHNSVDLETNLLVQIIG
ncbi:unnamed protein product [Vicia faba]|uniref:Uncharacterized protein n=1 Tax=Vicia faba TaxID=3906 RepID=A0AAV1AYS0_VICFA|nr:unnamed protein product [Vicia faba]